MSISKETRIVLLVAFLGASIVFFCGATSYVSRGDEPYHLRIASLIHETKSRPSYDPNLHTSPVTCRPLNVAIFWHAGLASVWWLAGNNSAILAQLYQSAWYFLLVIATYILARELYTREESLYSTLLVASIPASAAYTILLYTDIPLTVLSLFCFLFLIKKRYLMSGIFLGLMLLTKRNGILFIPLMILWIIYSSMELSTIKTTTYEHFKTILKSFLSWGCIRNLLVFSTPAMLITLPDLYFRQQQLHSVTFVKANTAVQAIYRDTSLHPVFVHPSNIFFHPESMLRELGAVVLLGLLLYVLYRKYEKRDCFVSLLAIGYIVLFPMASIGAALIQEGMNFNAMNSTRVMNIITSSMAIRYFIPVFPLLTMPAAVGLLSLTKRSLRTGVIILCVLQFFATSIYIKDFRTISPEVKTAFKYINNNITSGKNVLCPGTELLVYTSVSVMWDSDNTMPDLPYLFWKANALEAKRILKRYDISYIFLENSKIVNDSQYQNFGGFPKSFIENKMPTFRFLTLVFENPAVKIWRIDYQS